MLKELSKNVTPDFHCENKSNNMKNVHLKKNPSNYHHHT